MIPQLASALAGGYSTKQIMQFLIRQFPQHASKIKGALKAGFTVDQVVKFLGGGRKGVNQESEGLTEHEQVRSKDIQRRENVNQGALKGAGITALAGGTALAAPMARSALQRAAPQLFGPGAITSSSNTGLGPSSNNTGSPLPTQAPQIPQANLVSPSSSQPPVSSNIPQQANTNQLQVNPINISDLVNKHGLTKHIESLSSNVKDPKAIAGILYNKFPREMKKFQEEAGIPMEDAISEYMQGNVKPLDIAEVQKSEEPRKPLSREEAFGKFREKLIAKHEKGSTVESPQGIGEIKEIRNGKAIIDIDGKKHQVDEDELIESPMPEKDLADLLDDLIGGIESETGEDVSRMVQWAGYNPENNTLTFLPHTGKLYKYGGISKEDADLLTDILSVRKTSGSNFIGAWKKDSKSPIGAALSKLIRKLQSERGGKGNEYEETHEPIYSAYEPAIEAKKRKKKKK